MHTLYGFLKVRLKTTLWSSVCEYIVSTPTYKYMCLCISVTLHVWAHGPLHILHKIIYHIKTTQGSQKLEKLTENRRDHSQFWWLLTINSNLYFYIIFILNSTGHTSHLWANPAIAKGNISINNTNLFYFHFRLLQSKIKYEMKQDLCWGKCNFEFECIDQEWIICPMFWGH